MDHVRTSIAMKMLWKEIGAGGLEVNPSMLPVYKFNPIWYGRHWDALDALLLNLEHSEWSLHNLNFFNRELFIPAWKIFQRRTRKLRVLEIGVWCGQNGNYLLERYPNLHYVGIDPTILDEVQARFEKFNGENKKWEKFLDSKTGNEHIKGTRYELIKEKSEDVVEQFADQTFDLVFVDGPHTYRNVNRDITNYQRQVKPGGYLVGHDFSCVHPPLLWGVTEQRLYGGVINYGMDGVWWWRVPAE